jgi:hypothetical protein
MENTKQNLTSQQKRSRAAVDYSGCVCKSGGEATSGKRQAPSVKLQATSSKLDKI